MFADYQNFISVGAAITTLGGAWLTIRRIAKDSAKAKKEQAADILHAAKEEDAMLKAKLEARIEGLKTDLKNLEFNVNKDIEHVRDTYTSEIKNLGEKIESLREQLNSQHSQLITFLTKLIENQ